jgi:hypothetical protein
VNYTELKASIEQYLENSETTFVGSLDDFIRLAEERIVRFTKHPAFRHNQVSAFTISDNSLSKPPGFLTQYHMRVVNGTASTMLIPVEQGFIYEAYPDTTFEGVPRYYASKDETCWIVGPTPDAAYTVEVSFYRLPTSIVTAATTWIGDNAENALLYGSLAEAYRNMKGEPDLDYEGMFQSALQDLGKIGADRHAFDEYYVQIESI